MAEIRRRNRPSLVCSSCKNRKIKCDKGRPCIACVKANTGDLCTYDSNWLPTIKKKEKKTKSEIRFSDYVHSARVPMAVVPIKKEPLEEEPAMEEMVLIKKKELLALRKQLKILTSQPKSPTAFYETLPVLDFTGTYVYPGEPSMVLIGESRYRAWNQLGSLLKSPILHHPESPGLLPDALYTIEEEFDPATFKILSTNLVKNELIGINPYENEDDILEVTSDEPLEVDSVSCHNPMSWEGLVRRDYWARVLFQYTLAQKHQRFPSSRSSPTMVSETDCTSNSNSLNDTPSTLVEAFCKEQPFDSGIACSLERKETTRSNPISIPVGVCLTHVNAELTVIDQVLNAIPKKRVTWTLVNRYFQILYPFIPFLDEYHFRDTLFRILGPENYRDSQFTKLNVENSSDLAYLSILLVILRLSYLTLLSNRPSINRARMENTDDSPKAKEIKYLISNPINVSIIDVAHLTFNQFQTNQKITLPLLQNALFLKAYHSIAPEDGEFGPNYQVLHGTLVHMAFSLGLNHEPTMPSRAENMNPEEVAKIEREHHLRRKIWGHLRTNDFCESNKVGSPPAINILYYNTKFPFVKEGNENLFDVEMDRAITKMLSILEDFCIGPANQLLSISLNIRRGIKVAEYTKYLNHIELNSLKMVGRLPDYTQPLESKDRYYPYAKTTKCMISIYSRAFYMVVYFNLFSFYESKGNDTLGFFYLKKVFSITIGEMIPSLLPLAWDTETCLGEGSETVVNPAIIDSVYRANQVVIIILIRLQYYLYITNRSEEHQAQMDSNLKYKDHYTRKMTLVSLLKRCFQVFLATAKVLSNKSYSAWVTVKCHSFLLKVIEGDKLYMKTQSNVKLSEFTSTQIRELMSMCENGLKSLEKTIESHSKNTTLKDLLNNNQDDTVSPPAGNYNYTYLDQEPTLGTSAGNDMSDPFANIITELEAVDTEEIDSIWLNMLNGKQLKLKDIFDSDDQVFADPPKQPEPKVLSFSEKESDLFNSGYFDLFNDLPLNEVFSQNG